MEEEHGMKVIARIHNDFPTKFGIPHQSNRLDALKAKIVFEPEYRVPEAFRGLEEYDYIWLIWQFSETVRENWSLDCPAAEAWWKYTYGCICHEISISSKQHRAFFSASRKNRAASGIGTGSSYFRCGSYERYADL